MEIVKAATNFMVLYNDFLSNSQYTVYALNGLLIVD